MRRDRDTEFAALPWPEAEDVIAEAAFLVLPTGSTEQHSLHLPLGTDTLVTDWLVHELARRAPDHGLSLRVLPTLPYGYSEHHMGFAGKVTLSGHTFEEVVVEVGSSLAHHGANRLLIVNAHGGNDEPLKLPADRLQREHDLPVHFHPTDRAAERLADRFGEDWGHPGEFETGLVEHLFPDLVRDSRKREQTTPAPTGSRTGAATDC